MDIASQLASMLPETKPMPKILEIGCGTGFLTHHLLKKYPHGQFHITDISPDMVATCEAQYKTDRTSFFQMDGEHPECDDNYDFIVSSMAFQWFETPLKSLQALSKKGSVFYATLGHSNFPEWRHILNKNEFDNGLLTVPEWPKILNNEKKIKDYGSAYKFLKMLKDTGAFHPAQNYHNLSVPNLRKAICDYDALYQGKATWHITYCYQAATD